MYDHIDYYKYEVHYTLGGSYYTMIIGQSSRLSICRDTYSITLAVLTTPALSVYGKAGTSFQYAKSIHEPVNSDCNS